MEDLIKALQIFMKYENAEYPTYCGYDVLTIMDVNPEEVSYDDTYTLDELGFFIEDGAFKSYRFGSA